MKKYGNVYNINKRQTISSNTGVKLILNQYCWHCNNYNGDDVEIGEIVHVPMKTWWNKCWVNIVNVIDSMRKCSRAKTISLISSTSLYRGMQIRWKYKRVWQSRIKIITITTMLIKNCIKIVNIAISAISTQILELEINVSR